MLTTLERVDQEAKPAFESLDQDTYLALRGDFVLKVDGCRPILYPLDNNDPRVMILAPTEGLVLSLLSGRRTLGDVERLYQTFFPDGGPRNVITTIGALDALVKRNRTFSGIGKHGLFEYSSSPIESVHHFDPREFVIDPDEYRARLSDYKTKRRLEVPISILCVFTSRCTTNCEYCYADRQLTTEMSLGRWKDLVGEMRGLGIRLCASTTATSSPGRRESTSARSWSRTACTSCSRPRATCPMSPSAGWLPAGLRTRSTGC